MASATTSKKRGRPPKKKVNGVVEHFGEVTNGAEDAIANEQPYYAAITLQGTSKILFHAYNCEYVKAKNDAKKGSDIKKIDDLSKLVYRTDEGSLALPGINFIAALAYAGKRHKDPSSARKSAYDLCRAVLIPMNEFEPFHDNDGNELATWDFADTRRVVVQRSAIPRTRPGLWPGWKITFHLQVIASDLVSPDFLYKLTRDAGMFCGLGDFRPTFGRFNIVNFKITDEFD